MAAALCKLGYHDLRSTRGANVDKRAMSPPPLEPQVRGLCGTVSFLSAPIYRAFIARGRHEPAAEAICGGLVSFRNSLRVESQGQSWIRVSHSNLRSLQVRAILNERRCHRPAKVVKAELRKPRHLTSWYPDTIAPVGVAKQSPFGRNEQECFGIVTR